LSGPGFERRFLPVPSAVPPLRQELRRWLRRIGSVGGDESEDVLIVTTELVTNGVYHDGGDLITLRVTREPQGVAIEVTTVDHLPGHHPTHRDLVDPLETGLGLRIVRSMSEGFSVVMRGHERITSCRVLTGRYPAAMYPVVA
jgi:anti-sigma regulatory factor (Ser/Thr protein kinase)